MNSTESSLEERIQIWWDLKKWYENNYINISKYKCSSLRTGGKSLFSKKSELSDKAAGLSRRVWGQQKLTAWTEIPNQETKAKFSPVYTERNHVWRTWRSLICWGFIWSTTSHFGYHALRHILLHQLVQRNEATTRRLEKVSSLNTVLLSKRPQNL